MDPVTALANVTTATLNFLTAWVEGATPEQKQKVMDWFIADQIRWRKFFHLEP